MTNARLLALPLVMALAACGGNGGTPEGERKTAAGEVLGGSITDEMLPLDTITSQSPPLRETGEEPEAGADGPSAASLSPQSEASDEAADTAEAPEAAEAGPSTEPTAAADE